MRSKERVEDAVQWEGTGIKEIYITNMLPCVYVLRDRGREMEKVLGEGRPHESPRGLFPRCGVGTRPSYDLNNEPCKCWNTALR
jgi:hypothetical protein